MKIAAAGDAGCVGVGVGVRVWLAVGVGVGVWMAVGVSVAVGLALSVAAYPYPERLCCEKMCYDRQPGMAAECVGWVRARTVEDE